MDLLTLFMTALVAATLLPAQSEIVLGALVLAGAQPVWLLLAWPRPAMCWDLA